MAAARRRRKPMKTRFDDFRRRHRRRLGSRRSDRAPARRRAAPRSPSSTCSASAGEKVAAEIGGLFCETDVTNEPSIDAALTAARKAHGTERVLVCCAGVGPARRTVSKKRDTGELLAHDVAMFRRTIEINLIGTFAVDRPRARPRWRRSIRSRPTAAAASSSPPPRSPRRTARSARPPMAPPRAACWP